MQTQITIQDYTFDSVIPKHGWAKVELLGRSVDFNFTNYDAVTAAIELGYIEQPEDRDNERIGYEHSAFSAIVRDFVDSSCLYHSNESILSDLENTQFGENIVINLAHQSNEVWQVIQNEAKIIIFSHCPVGMVELNDIYKWFANNHEQFFSKWGSGIDFESISNEMKFHYYAAEQETLSQL